MAETSAEYYFFFLILRYPNCKEVIIGVNDDSIEGGFLGPYNYSNCQGSASSHRFSYLFRPSIKASHRIASQAVNNSLF